MKTRGRGFFVMTFMCAVLAVAAMANAAGGGALLRIDATEYNGGPVAQNAKVEAVFTLRNLGTDTLVITSLRAPCGCTVAEYDREIPPQGIGYIRPVVDVTGMGRGIMSRTVNVTTNAANMPTLTLTITANVQ